MNKLILGAILLFSTIGLTSCSNENEQIEVVKRRLADSPYRNEYKAFSFECLEVLDSDVYKYNIEKTEKFGDRYKRIKIEKYQDSLMKSTGKKFYKVHFFRLIGKDTVNDGFIFLNEKNKTIGFNYKK